MNRTIVSDGKTLRCGITTGTCAAAASCAAAKLLLLNERVNAVSVKLPDGKCVDVPVQSSVIRNDCAIASVVKNAGDDPDITNGTTIVAEIAINGVPDIVIEGGEGVGRVTLPGLDQPIGAAAINSTPRRMIREAVSAVLESAGVETGLHVCISVPDGARLARQTFNPRLGIEGGISILGTTGIVEPMSEKALIDTIKLEANVRAQRGRRTILYTPGNYGRSFLMRMADIPDESVVRCSNFIGDALDEAVRLTFEDIMLVGHLGKLVKLSGNMFNTHSKYGDMRLEALTAHAAMLGASASTAKAMMRAATVDAALDAAQNEIDIYALTDSLLKRIEDNIRMRVDIPVQVLIFTNARGRLAQSAGFGDAFDRFLKEEGVWYTS